MTSATTDPSNAPSNLPSNLPLEGGCFCGAIRYRVSQPAVLQLHCYCKDCLATSGTDGYAGYMVANEHFSLQQGQPSVHRKTSAQNRTVERHFCGTCGTNLWGQTELGLVSIAAGTLDDPSVFQPNKSAFVEDAPTWARVPSHLEPL